jgi:hypothetical protein
MIFSLLGLLTTTLFASIWAIFGRINIEFHFFLLTINVIIFFLFKIQILTIYNNLLLDIGYLKKGIKLLFFFLTLLIVAQCAALPFIIDNETYYVQTIKWLNEYGFVKGLANLHIFLGQTSGWHITQSAFSFSFLYQNFNDLSGFCLLLGNFYAIKKLILYLKNESIIDLIFGLFLIFNPLLFQFISAPSPDIAVFVISYVLFFLFIDNFEKPTATLINLQWVLCFFVIYIKPTSIVILIIPIVLLLTNYKTIQSKWYGTAGIGVLFLFLFTIKNTILTGYPLYPTQLVDQLSFDFSIPNELIDFYFSEAKLYGFFLTRDEFNEMSTYQIIIKWLTVTKINGTFNILSLLIVTTIPFFIHQFHSKKAVWILYFVMLFQLIVLLLTSPQFRFFLNFIILFTCFILACLFQRQKKSIYLFVYASTLVAFVLVMFPINISFLTKNKLFTSTSSFHLTQLIFPSENSNLKSYTVNRLGNLIYDSPDNTSYFWYGGNGKLPCVNKQQLDYFESNFYFIPQKRTSDLKDGFYSKKKSSND